MQEIVNLVSEVPNGAYYSVAAATVISMILQFVKSKLELQSDKVITFLLFALSFIGVAIDYLTQAVATNPSVLGKNTFLIMGISTVAYRYLVKPSSKFLTDVKEYRARKERVGEDVVVAPVATDPVIESAVVEPTVSPVVVAHEPVTEDAGEFAA